jgi:hypothetical protein
MPNEADDIRERTARLSGTWYRLIASRFPTVDLYERIAVNGAQDILVRIETLTNPRVRDKEEAARVSSIDVETSPKFQNWNQAPFSYPNPAGSRYVGPLFRAMELFASLNGALAAAIKKRETFLAATEHRATNLDMRVLRHDFGGEFVDRTCDPIDMPQEERWKIGERLLKAGKHGVYYRCPELPHCFAVSLFDGEGLGPARQAEHFRFRWDGHRIPWIYPYSDDSDGRPITVEEILAPPRRSM